MTSLTWGIGRLPSSKAHLVRGLVGSAGWTRILNDAEDSPLVDGNGGVGDENQFSGVLAVIYAF